MLNNGKYQILNFFIEVKTKRIFEFVFRRNFSTRSAFIANSYCINPSLRYSLICSVSCKITFKECNLRSFLLKSTTCFPADCKVFTVGLNKGLHMLNTFTSITEHRISIFISRFREVLVESMNMCIVKHV